MKVLSFLLICVVLVTHTGHALALSADPPPPSFPLNPPPPPNDNTIDGISGAINDGTSAVRDGTQALRDFENDINSEIAKARAAALEELKFMDDARKALDDAWKEYIGFYNKQKKKLIDAFAKIPFADIGIVRSILNRLIHQLDLMVVGQFMGYHAQVMAALDVGNLIPNPRFNALSQIAGQVDGIVTQVDFYAAQAQNTANYVEDELENPEDTNFDDRGGNGVGDPTGPGPRGPR